jgi:hypothetical protein
VPLHGEVLLIPRSSQSSQLLIARGIYHSPDVCPVYRCYSSVVRDDRQKRKRTRQLKTYKNTLRTAPTY